HNPELELKAVVDADTRLQSSIHHSATHLLHAALKQVLGEHVNQKGSLVNAEMLRFDFSHFAKVTDDELKKIEHIVNEKIRAAVALDEKRNVPIQEALKTGANALFGEKYGDYVRVITFDPNFSIELCGGTHVQNTSTLGYFKIISESSVAAGVRRIEAVAGKAADYYIENALATIEQAKEKLKSTGDLLKSIQALQYEKSKLEAQLEKLNAEQLASEKEKLKQLVKQVRGLNVLIAKANLYNADALKNLCFEFKNQFENLFCVIGTIVDEKPMLAAMISENLVNQKGLNASNIVREIAKEIQGGGGGQAFFATAGGKNAEGLDSALAKSKKLIENITADAL
ncbi:MAG: DHHA1 domain-containing protein, partial [Cytophagales bacterium]